MAKGQQRDPKREAFWRGALARFDSSGLSVRSFCARERLTEPCFYAWRRVIRERDAERPETRPAFVPLVVRADRGDCGIVIDVSGGPRSVALRLPAALPMGQVAELVQALVAVPASGCGAVEGRP